MSLAMTPKKKRNIILSLSGLPLLPIAAYSAVRLVYADDTYVYPLFIFSSRIPSTWHAVAMLVQ